MRQAGAVVLARLDSSRFPGKALRQMFGYPLIELVARRLVAGGLKMNEIALATTQRDCDDPLAAWANRFGVRLYRGATENVALRCLECAEAMHWQCFARVNGDSPFVCGTNVAQALDFVLQGNCDFVTNLSPRTYPYGVAIEVMATSFYRRTLSTARPNELEHVTAHLYRNPPARRRELRCKAGNLSNIHLTIDTKEDEDRLTGLLNTFEMDPMSVDPVALALSMKRDLSV